MARTSFYEVLDEALAIIEREQRVTYRALRRALGVDDEYLEDLKAEIVDAKQLAIDEGGKVLVWTGRPPAHAAASTKTEEAADDDAERRQVTVMFCDLVDSSGLSARTDPEDLRAVVRSYQAACAEVVEHFGGYIAQYLGDGILIYYGFPVAHEDGARRAVRSALGIFDAIQGLNHRLRREHRVEIQTRVGIHTGLVVVGEVGGGVKREQLAMGETPNVAARLEGLAKPSSVVVSEATRRLVDGYFEFEPLGPQQLKGIPQPVPVYRVLSERASQSPLDAAMARGLTQLTGRDHEVEALLARWAQVDAERGASLLLTGEAGIGKSRLVQVLSERLASEGVRRLECRCSPYFQNSGLYPVVELMQRVLGLAHEDSAEDKVRKLEDGLARFSVPLAESVPIFGWLLSVPLPEARYAPLGLTPMKLKQRALTLLTTTVAELAALGPLLYAVEDLHWVDPSTLEFLAQLRDVPGVFLLMTARPGFQSPWGDVDELVLGRLDRAGVEAMVYRVSGGRALPAPLLAQLLEKSDGIPLFVEEQTKMVIESDLVCEVDGEYRLTDSDAPLAIASTLHDSLMARLDRLGDDKRVAQLAATLGRSFAFDLLQEVSGLGSGALSASIARLEQAGLIRQVGASHTSRCFFKHALIRDAAYQSLLKRARLQHHARIASALEERFAERAEAEPELLAHHHTEAGNIDVAVSCWSRAAERALQRASDLEAIAHSGKALELLAVLPESAERDGRELALQMTRGPALMATQGYGAQVVEQVYSRARVLCDNLGESPQTFAVLFGLWTFHVVRTHLDSAREIGHQLLDASGRLGDPGLVMEAHVALGWTDFFEGRFGEARSHLERALELYDPALHRGHGLTYGQEPGMSAHSALSIIAAVLGDLDAAFDHDEASLAIVSELTHPNSIAFGLNVAAWFRQHVGEPAAAGLRAREAIHTSAEQSLAYFLAMGRILAGWADNCAAEPPSDAGIVELSDGLELYGMTGAVVQRCYFVELQADACRRAGRIEQGLEIAQAEITAVERSGERWRLAELKRVQGELLTLAGGDRLALAQASFEEAVQVARTQGARLFELRAALSLARLMRRRDRVGDARTLLSGVLKGSLPIRSGVVVDEARDLLRELQA